MVTRTVPTGLCCTLVAGALAGALVAGCSGGQAPTADLAKISDLKSSFGPQFKVTEVAPTGIDPKFLVGQPLPGGLRFQPESCAKFAAGQLVPAGTEGNMSAVSAEGEGNSRAVSHRRCRRERWACERRGSQPVGRSIPRDREGCC